MKIFFCVELGLTKSLLSCFLPTRHHKLRTAGNRPCRPQDSDFTEKGMPTSISRKIGFIPIFLYNRGVLKRSFNVGDRVYRKILFHKSCG
jgi:hypothetical protein